MDYYQKNSSEYINKTKDADLSKERDELLKMLPKKCKILDIGFGSGRDSLAFKELGYDVISIDSCNEFCEYGKSLGLNVMNINVKDITFNNEFDGIWACASLLHIEYNELANVFNKIRIAMKDDAAFYCSFKYGDFEGVKDERYYTDMTLEKIQAVLINTNLRIIKYWLKEDSLNRDNKWISFLLKKEK